MPTLLKPTEPPLPLNEASERDESAKIRGAKIVAGAVPPVPTKAEVA